MVAHMGLAPESQDSSFSLNAHALTVTSRRIGKALTHCRDPLALVCFPRETLRGKETSGQTGWRIGR